MLTSHPLRAYAICAGLSLAPALALGFGRFAYALVLPAMRQDFGWTFSEAGALNSANAVGHLLGALGVIWLIRRFGAAPVLVGATVLTALALLATALAGSFEMLLTVRFLPGVTGAASFVAGGVLAAEAADRLGSRAAVGVGIYYAGPGLGIMLSSALTTPALAAGAANWPVAWIAMGAVAVLMTAFVVAAARAAANAAAAPGPTGRAGAIPLWPALLGYGFYATGYVGYITFIIAAVREDGGSAAVAAAWWAGLGLASIVAVWLWSGLLRRARGGGALALLIGLTGAGAALPLVVPGPVGFLASFLLFGGTFLSVVSATTNLVRLARPPQDWAKWIALFTLVFGVGQSLGPMASGMVSDYLGTADGTLWTSAALLIAGAAVAAGQRRLR